MKVIKHQNRFYRKILKYQLLEICSLVKVLNNLNYIWDLTRWFPEVLSSIVINSDYSMFTLI